MSSEHRWWHFWKKRDMNKSEEPAFESYSPAMQDLIKDVVSAESADPTPVFRYVCFNSSNDLYAVSGGIAGYIKAAGATSTYRVVDAPGANPKVLREAVKRAQVMLKDMLRPDFDAGYEILVLLINDWDGKYLSFLREAEGAACPMLGWKWDGHKGVVRSFSDWGDRGRDYNGSGEMRTAKERLGDAMSNAIRERDIDSVRLLLAKGCDPNGTNSRGGRFLNLALKPGKRAAEIVTLLIEKGANVNIRCTYSPLEQAVRDGLLVVARILLENGADANGRDRNRETPLHHMLKKHERLDIAELLLSNGADVNAQEEFCKNTPLHLAANYRRRNMAKLLLARGADPRIEDSSGDTALDRISKRGWSDIAKMAREKWKS